MNYLIESTPQKSNASYNEFYGKYRSPYAKTS